MVVVTGLDEQPDVGRNPRAQHKRDGLRFASDLTDAEWLVISGSMRSALPNHRTGMKGDCAAASV
jgi:hypothetical protein